jgi:ankyrin repeat protein
VKFNKITLSLSIIIFFSILNNKLSFSKEKKVVEKTSAKKITTQDELNSKLFNAISNKNIGLVKKLIEEGANVNSKKDLSSSQKAFTPLILSTNLNQKEISIILVNKGADVNLTDKEGRTPLSNILDRNNRDFINIFLNAGLKEDIFLFIELEEFDKINDLIKKGYDLNKKSKNGKLPLIEACKKGNKQIIEIILAKGADITLKDSDGDTSLISLASTFAFSSYDINKKEIDYLEIANLLITIQWT